MSNFCNKCPLGPGLGSTSPSSTSDLYHRHLVKGVTACHPLVCFSLACFSKAWTSTLLSLQASMQAVTAVGHFCLNCAHQRALRRILVRRELSSGWRFGDTFTGHGCLPMALGIWNSEVQRRQVSRENLLLFARIWPIVGQRSSTKSCPWGLFRV